MLVQTGEATGEVVVKINVNNGMAEVERTEQLKKISQKE